MSTRPMFTVAIPVYNTERYLYECLDSVAQQSFRDFEVIVVDDGSTDGSPTIIADFVERYENFHVVTQENSGRLLARRRAMFQARGYYLIYLDSDDILRLDALEVINCRIEQAAADIVIFEMSYEADFSNGAGCPDLPSGYYVGQGYGLAKRAALRGRMNSMWGKAIALATLDLEESYTEYQGLSFAEDLFQLLPIVDRATSCVCMDETLYFYRRSPESSTMSYDSRQFNDLKRVASRVYEYGTRWNLYDSANYGVLMQYCNLLKILVHDDNMETADKRFELARIGTTLQEIESFGRFDSELLRFDNRLLLAAVKAGRYRCAFAAVRVVDQLKWFFSHLKSM